MSQYLARLCWNSKGWILPTGESAGTERDTYVSKSRFGMEEWLFNFQWVLNGWKYAFLQPVNKSYENVRGSTIDVRLYTIGGEHGWYYIGRIPRCEVITEEQARHAKAEFDRRGWTDDMKAHVRAIGGSVRELRGPARYVFNVRFRPSAAQLYDPLVPVGKHDMVRKFRRYTLTLMRGKAARVEEQWPYRRGTTALHRTGKQRRRGTDGVVANLAERQLQNELFRLLKNEFGANSTIMEEGFADLSLTLDKVVHLFEVKADPVPRKAIRSALGQLLEYAWTRQRKGQKIGLLVVAAPGELDIPTRRYIGHLQTGLDLPIHYLRIRRGQKRIELPLHRSR